ncbi:MAG TPA: YncE family protein [Acidimicrobiales bacterium]|nr:YncE family protein [Acidimicrobiales bacterium]
MTPRGFIAFLVMVLTFAGCGVATMTESGVLPAVTDGSETLQVTLAPPQALSPVNLRASRPTGSRLAAPVAVADGETAVEPTASSQLAQPAMRVGPVVPGPAGPPWPVVDTQPAAVAPGPVNIYSHTLTPHLSPAVANVPLRVYVPNSDAASVSVIDPTTMRVVDRFSVGIRPHHVTPSWDLTKLYVNNTEGNTLTEIDPMTGRAVRNIPITDPYNLYFTPDGTKAIVVAERYQRLDFYDAADWTFLKTVGVPWAGVDHGDFTADGRYFIASCEFSGQVVKVDTETMELVGRVNVGSLPIDVKTSPDGTVLYVANQGRHGVSLVDPETMTEIGFLPTGTGAHGLNVSRDAATLFVSNRMEGTISVIDFATRSVRQTWRVGGSPDMIQVSGDGAQLWVSNRFHGSVSVIDTTDGRVIATIPTGAGAHGVSLFPQPGRYSVGHNGVYR